MKALNTMFESGISSNKLDDGFIDEMCGGYDFIFKSIKKKDQSGAFVTIEGFSEGKSYRSIDESLIFEINQATVRSDEKLVFDTFSNKMTHAGYYEITLGVLHPGYEQNIVELAPFGLKMIDEVSIAEFTPVGTFIEMYKFSSQEAIE